MDRKIFEVVERKLKAAGVEQAFYDNLMAVYQRVSEKSEKNKKKHFKVQKKILFGTFFVSVVNITASIASGYKEVSVIIPVLTGIASIISVFVTLCIGQKNSGKYSETWMRHQRYKANLEFVIMDYAFDNDNYADETAEIKAKMFVKEIMEISKLNQNIFEKNMKNFDVEK